MNTLVLRGPVNVSFLLPLHDSFLSGDWAFLLDEVLGLWWEATPHPCGVPSPRLLPSSAAALLVPFLWDQFWVSMPIPSSLPMMSKILVDQVIALFIKKSSVVPHLLWATM